MALLLGMLQKKMNECKNKDEFLLYKINIALISSALCEAIINRFVSYKVKSKTKFNNFDKYSLYDKWIEFPKTFFPSYKLHEDISINLKILIEWRKNFVHSKPKMGIDNMIALKGNQPMHSLNNKQITEFVELPLKLAEEVLKIDGSSFFKGDYYDYKKAIKNGNEN